MPFWFQFIFFAVGLVLIIKGGDYFVDAASWFAEVSGIPKFIVGATVVSIATTLPELLVSLIAAIGGKVDMAVGNAVGSVTVNTGLILAISLFFTVTAAKRSDYLIKALLLIAAATILLVSGQGGSFAVWGSAVLIVIFGLFVWENVSSAMKNRVDEEKEKPTKKLVIINIIKFVFGTAGIVFGSDLLVDSSSEIALHFGISEALISATIVAIGTSLPELVTTVTSVVKKQTNLGLGNILGANIIDLTLIMPLCSLVSGKALPLSTQALSLDLPFCLLTIVVAIVPLLIRQKTGKIQGLVTAGVYATYITLLLI
ncbi:MAG: calcium/sodium antiporter [Clostridia bacterium]|nr:calcium/sodium antiporter [Clostridia bacterium]